jgi:hypothetical protein
MSDRDRRALIDNPRGSDPYQHLTNLGAGPWDVIHIPH